MPASVDTQGVRARLGELLVAQGRYREALPLMEEVADDLRRAGPAERQNLVYRLEELARVRLAVGDTPGAVTAVDEAIGLCIGLRAGSRVPYLGAIRAAATGDLDAAARLFAEAVDRGLVAVEPLRDGVVLRRLRGRPDFERARTLLEARRVPFEDRFAALWEWPPPQASPRLPKSDEAGPRLAARVTGRSILVPARNTRRSGAHRGTAV